MNPFLPMALLAGCVAAVTSGIVGSYIVIKRIVFLSGSIAHSVLGGMGFFLWLRRVHGVEWITPLQGALLAAILSAFVIGWIHLRYREREDTVIAAIWSTGMAIGVIFISLTPGYNVELMNFLFGNILWVTSADIYLLIALDVLVLVSTMVCYRQFLAVSFDEEQTALQGVSVKGYYLFLLCLVAISVVVLIEVVGAILVITMLAIPAAIAGSWTQNLKRMMTIAVLLGCLFTGVGLMTSFHLNWPPGATIALVAALFYIGNFLKVSSNGR